VGGRETAHRQFKEDTVTKEQAIELAQSGWWKDKTPHEIVSFQLYEKLLCMDFGDFHEAVEKVLDRPVWTHEFGSQGHLKEEFEGKCGKPSFEDILNLLPKDKTIVVGI